MEDVIISNVYAGRVSDALANFLEELNDCQNLGEMKSFLQENRSINYHWHITDKENQNRGLLIVSAKKSAEPTELHKSLCGTIFNFDFKRKFPFVISIIPPQTAFDRTDFGKILHSSNAKLYRLHDGSMINLHYNDIADHKLGWVVSTTNGCYMNDVKWSELTFMELIIVCLASRNITIDNLNKSSTYSFICKHPSMHPLVDKPEFVVIASTDPNLPVDDAEVPISDFKTLSLECEQALDNYTDGCVPHYGYIVRNDHTTAVLKSTLMKFIFDYHHNVPQFLLQDPRRKKWQDLRGYMSINNAVYAKIFKSQQQFNEFDAKFATLVQKIITYHHMATKPNTDPLVVGIYEYVHKMITIDSPIGVKLLKDLIIHPNRLSSYLNNGFLD